MITKKVNARHVAVNAIQNVERYTGRTGAGWFSSVSAFPIHSSVRSARFDHVFVLKLYWERKRQLVRDKYFLSLKIKIYIC
tara:strand:+ start:299 stop:541 length:243 start_codon:yes stop_codon:yes gene_type:complete